MQTYDDILYDDKIIFTSYDSYYHARLIQNTVHNFPHRVWFDPYSLYPFGQPVMFGPLYDTLAAFVAIIIGFGNPSNFLIEIVAVVFPMLFAMLSVPLVYLISRISFNRLSAIISVIVFSAMNGEFLHRSMFGNADHHMAELFFSLLFVLFFIFALKRKKILHFSIAGIILGCYFLIWYGAIIFYFILILFLITVNFTQNKKYNLKIILLSIIPLLFYLIFATGYSPYSLGKEIYLLIFISPIVLQFIINKIKNYNKKILIGSLGIIVLLLIYFQFQIRRMLILPIKYTLSNKVASELDSILSYSSFSLPFYLLLSISIISLFLLFCNSKKNDTYIFIGLWSCIIILLPFLQIRFSYYLPANIAILVGYITTRLKTNKLLFTYIAIIMLILMPTSISTYNAAQDFAPNFKEIYIALEWMKSNTPKLDLDYYAYHDETEKVSNYLIYNNTLVCENEKLICAKNPCLSYNYYRVIKLDNKIKNKSCKLFSSYPFWKYYNYTNSSYGIMNVYPYGHLITYIAKRIPITNGFLFHQGLTPSEKFFTAQNEKDAKEILNNFNTRYILLDDYSINAIQYMNDGLDSRQNMFSRQDSNNYIQEIKFTNNEQEIYLPNYYKSIVTRLYLYNGEAYAPTKSYVFINNEIRKFEDYQSALEYTEKNNNSIIIGINPYESPIPLEKIEDFQLIYESNISITRTTFGEIKQVKIFQYKK